MKRSLLVATTMIALASLTVVQSAAAEGDPAVKMSKSKICHEKGTEFYARVKKFTAYDSMSACLAAGGREPKASGAKKDTASTAKSAAPAPVVARAPKPIPAPSPSPAPSPAKK